MSLGLQILVYTVGGLVAIAIGVALLKSGKPVRGLLSSGVQGVCALAAVNVAGAFTTVSLGFNLLSGLCCLVLGIPGVITLLVLKVIFQIG